MSAPDYTVVSRELMIVVECSMKVHNLVREHFFQMGYTRDLRAGPKPIGQGRVDTSVWYGVLSGPVDEITEEEA